MKTLRVAACLVALLFSSYAPQPAEARAQLFTSVTQAQQHCPTDVVVWVNTASGIYHFRGQRYYANTKNGAFVCKKDADVNGMRATRNGQ
jgi:hypothetical protein